jgi:hypothetical protein
MEAVVKLIAGIEMEFAYYLDGSEVWRHYIDGKEFLYHLKK